MTLVNFVNNKHDDTVEFGDMYVGAVFEYLSVVFKKVSCAQAIKLDTLTIANFNQSDSVTFLRSDVEVDVEDSKQSTVFTALGINEYFVVGGGCMRKVSEDAAISFPDLSICRIADDRTVFPCEPISIRVTVKPNVVGMADDDF